MYTYNYNQHQLHIYAGYSPDRTEQFQAPSLMIGEYEHAPQHDGDPRINLRQAFLDGTIIFQSQPLTRSPIDLLADSQTSDPPTWKIYAIDLTLTTLQLHFVDVTTITAPAPTTVTYQIASPGGFRQLSLHAYYYRACERYQCCTHPYPPDGAHGRLQCQYDKINFHDHTATFDQSITTDDSF